MPTLQKHLGAQREWSVWCGIAKVLKAPNHRRAFAFFAPMMAMGLTVISFFTTCLEANVGLSEARVFRCLVVGEFVPVLATTWMPPMPLPAVLVISTLL